MTMKPIKEPTVISLLDINLRLCQRKDESPSPFLKHRIHFSCTTDVLERFPSKDTQHFKDIFYDLGFKLKMRGLWLKKREHQNGTVQWILSSVPNCDADGISYEDYDSEKQICEVLSKKFDVLYDKIEDFKLMPFANLQVDRVAQVIPNTNTSVHIDVVRFCEGDYYVVGALSTAPGDVGRVSEELEQMKVVCPVRSKVTEYIHKYFPNENPSPGQENPSRFLSEMDLNHFTESPFVVPELISSYISESRDGSSKLHLPSRKETLATESAKFSDLNSISAEQMSRKEIESMLKEAEIEYNDALLNFLEKNDEVTYPFTTRNEELLLKFGLRAVEDDDCSMEGISYILRTRRSLFRTRNPGSLVVAVGSIPSVGTLYMSEECEFFLNKIYSYGGVTSGYNEAGLLHELDKFKPSISIST